MITWPAVMSTRFLHVQVREHMRTSKATLQKLNSVAAAAAQALSSMQPANIEKQQAEDSYCIIYQDEPTSIKFE